MSQGIMNVLLLFPVFLFSLCIHEFAHALIAVRLGDPTPRVLGRLTLHPLAHADWVGTIILPGLCLYYGFPFFGWAKPVPVDIRNLSGGRRDMAWVASAGPISNILLAVLSTLILALLGHIPWEAQFNGILQVFLILSIQINLMLAFFNLIPIPPLDGFLVLQGFVPAWGARRMHRLMPYSGLLLLVLLVSGALRYLSIPVYGISQWLLKLAEL